MNDACRFVARLTALCALLCWLPAEAASQRTFVASYGNDGDPCSLGAPCRGFAAAIAKTLAGGEVVVLDSAGYGPMTIAQDLTITAPAGVYAGISVSTAIPGIDIVGDVNVTVRNLSIVNIGSGTAGVRVTSGTTVFNTHIELSGVRIDGFPVGVSGTLARNVRIALNASSIVNVDTGVEITSAALNPQHTLVIRDVEIANRSTSAPLLHLFGCAFLATLDSVVFRPAGGDSLFVEPRAGCTQSVTVARSTFMSRPGGSNGDVRIEHVGLASSSSTSVTVMDSQFVQAGISVSGDSGNTFLAVARSTFTENGISTGEVVNVDLTGTAGARVALSEVQIQRSTGIFANNAGTGVVALVIDRSTITASGQDAVEIGDGVELYLKSNSFVRNASRGVRVTGTGQAFSAGDNMVSGNGSASSAATAITPY